MSLATTTTPATTKFIDQLRKDGEWDMPTPKKKTAAKTETGTRGPTKVTYPAKAVDTMAEAVKKTTGGRARYMNLMTPLVDQPGQLFLLAEYQAEGGASRVKSQINRGKTEVPHGRDAWELTAVKTTVQDEDGNDTVGSHLYVRYVGENGTGGADNEG